jgi:hypothetical protein
MAIHVNGLIVDDVQLALDQGIADGLKEIAERPKAKAKANGKAPGAPPTIAGILKAMTFAPLKYVVPGIIVEGLTLFAGKPKIGKSWLLFHAAIAVARGGFTLGEIKCPEGDVLYCAIEDNLRRLKSRMMKLLGPDQDWPNRLAFRCELPRLGQGGLDTIKAWIASVPDPRLIIIDTLAMVKAPKGKNDNPYDADYTAVQELRTFAAEQHVAAVVVHHLRKADADDAFDTVSGTLGLTGAPDTILILKHDSNGQLILHGRGRDLTEIEQAMEFNKDACTWAMLGDASQFRAETSRGGILAAMAEIGEPTTPNEVAAMAHMKVNTARQTMLRLNRTGDIRRVGYGKYALQE